MLFVVRCSKDVISFVALAPRVVSFDVYWQSINQSGLAEVTSQFQNGYLGLIKWDCYKQGRIHFGYIIP